MHKFLFTLALLVSAGCTSGAKSTYEPEADREGIRGVFQARMKELRNCYYETLDANPAAEGKVMINFDLGPDGKAQNTKVETVKGRRGIEAIGPCLTMRINSWQFPKPSADEPTSVSYPLFFSENGRTNFDEPATKTRPKPDLEGSDPI